MLELWKRKAQHVIVYSILPDRSQPQGKHAVSFDDVCEGASEAADIPLLVDVPYYHLDHVNYP